MRGVRAIGLMGACFAPGFIAAGTVLKRAPE